MHPNPLLTDHLMTEEVLASGDTRGNSECDFALVGNHTIDTPGLVGDIKTVLVDLEPLQTGDVRLSRVRDLSPADSC